MLQCMSSVLVPFCARQCRPMHFRTHRQGLADQLREQEMSDGQFVFDPFWMFRWPFSGDVKQRFAAPSFSPSFTVNYAGDPKIEERVVTEVASYGRQRVRRQHL